MYPMPRLVQRESHGAAQGEYGDCHEDDAEDYPPDADAPQDFGLRVDSAPGAPAIKINIHMAA
jgi:hypothetical protein